MQLTGIILRDINRIAEYLSRFLDELRDSGEYEFDKPEIYVAPIGRDENQDKSGICISLLHLEEETSTKQQIPTATGWFALAKPEMVVNLYVMFSAQGSSYDLALQNISWVLQAFQSSTVIPGSSENEVVVNVGEDLDVEATKDAEQESLLKVSYETEALRMSIHQMTMDQMSNLWQTLGAKMMPAVIYKVRMLTIKSNEIIPVYPIRKDGIKTRIEQARPEEMAAKNLIEEEEKRILLEREKEAEREKARNK